MLPLRSFRIGTYYFSKFRAGNVMSGLVKSHPPILHHLRHCSSFDDDDDDIIIKRGLVVKLAHQKYQLVFESDDTVPIIILHGLLGSKSNWHSLARAIHEGSFYRKVITIDARNHGDSPQVPEFTYEDMVCDLLKFLDEENINKASFIGHSMGGRVCMLLSLLFPKKVHSLVIVDISPIDESGNMLALNGILKALVDLKLDQSAPLRVARKQAADQLRKSIEDEQLINFLLTNLVEKDDSTEWRWRINTEAIYHNFIPNICKFPIPSSTFNGRTLFVVGMKSDYVMPNAEEPIKQVFVNAQFSYIEGAGHWVHSEKPKEFLSTVLKFLNGDGPVTD